MPGNINFSKFWAFVGILVPPLVMVTFAEKFKWMYNLKNHPSITLALQSHILEFSIIRSRIKIAIRFKSYWERLKTDKTLLRYPIIAAGWTLHLHLDNFSDYETCISHLDGISGQIYIWVRRNCEVGCTLANQLKF